MKAPVLYLLKHHFYFPYYLLPLPLSPLKLPCGLLPPVGIEPPPITITRTNKPINIFLFLIPQLVLIKIFSPY